MRKMPFLIAFSVLLLFAQGAFSADFTVNPVNILLGQGRNSALLTVTNNGGERLTLQLSAYHWDQDAEGKDIYKPSEEIIFFPRIFSLKEGEERIVRLGAAVPPGQKEGTYRIYLEEVPQPEEDAQGGAVLKTVMRVGVPVFVAPMRPVQSGAIDEIGITAGRLVFLVRNTGNSHLRVRSVKVEGLDTSGAKAFETEIAGWYVLEGRSRRFGTDLPKEKCLKVTRLDIVADADAFTLKESFDVLPAMCVP